MNSRRHRAQLALFILAILSLATAASCSPPWANRKADFELTGQALDFDTKQPIEGAYVLAVYEKVDLGMAGASRYCVKTKGMLSDNEGRFHFPIDKLDGNSPYMVYAIKADYFLRDWELPTPDSVRGQTKQAYTNRHVYLKKQDPAKPEYLLREYRECGRPETREAAKANIAFLTIKKEEYVRLQMGDARIKNIEAMIQSLEATTASVPVTQK
jgi:hypothetical protein